MGERVDWRCGQRRGTGSVKGKRDDEIEGRIVRIQGMRSMIVCTYDDGV